MDSNNLIAIAANIAISYMLVLLLFTLLGGAQGFCMHTLFVKGCCMHDTLRALHHSLLPIMLLIFLLCYTQVQAVGSWSVQTELAKGVELERLLSSQRPAYFYGLSLAQDSELVSLHRRLAAGSGLGHELAVTFRPLGSR